MKTTRRTLSLLLALTLLSASAWGQTKPPASGATPEPRLVTDLRNAEQNAKYASDEAVVISLNIMDYAGSDNTGNTDQAPLIRTLLSKLGTGYDLTPPGSTNANPGNANGGILYLPEGIYKVESTIVVPKGVTIRGDWKKPVRGEKIEGTIISTTHGKNSTGIHWQDRDQSLIMLRPTAAVKDLAFWYPEQDPSNIVPYPPTISFGARGHWGNEYCVAKNVTFINAYAGCNVYSDGGAPNMFGIYGTPLKRGCEIDFLAEVGRIETVDFAPDYWIGSELPGAPSGAGETALRDWLYNEAAGIVMRRNDWTLTSDITVDGYCIGFYLGPTPSNTALSGTPNGQNYLLHFTNCQTGVYADDGTSAGVMFHDVHIDNCEFGLFVSRLRRNVLTGSCWSINATKYAIAFDRGFTGMVFLNQSRIVRGDILTLGGTLDMVDCDIDTPKPQITIGMESRAILAGNRFAQGPEIINSSMFECFIDHTPLDNFPKIPEFPFKYTQSMPQKPNRLELYNAATYGARRYVRSSETNSSFDSTKSIQDALDKARDDGGGVVYLPQGKYRINSSLTIPTGVELHGSTDVGSVPTGPGSVLDAYGGKGKADDPPLINMEPGSGIRGIVINYPEQMFEEIHDPQGGNDPPLSNQHPSSGPEHARCGILVPHVYPYAIRANEGCWIVNVGFRATFSGMDLFTNECHNVYIEYPSGHLFTNGVRIGGGTDGAVVRNAQFNTIGYAYGDQDKFGEWENARPNTGWCNYSAYAQNYKELNFFQLEDSTNSLLFNNFYFACYIGCTFGCHADPSKAPTGLGMGHGIDAALKALYFYNLGRDGFDLVGTQIVSTRKNDIQGMDADTTVRYIETDPQFTGTANMYLINAWGSPNYGVEVNGGTVNLLSVRIRETGRNRFFKSSGGLLRVRGSSINNEQGARGNMAETEAERRRLHITHSVVDVSSPYTDFETNLSRTPTLSFDEDNMLDRDGWTAYSNVGTPGNMLDDNYTTRWATNRTMTVGDWISVTMGREETFDTIYLNQGTSTNDWPREYTVQFWEGENWGTTVLSGTGTSGAATVIRFPDPVQATRIRINLTGTGGATGYWSVYEFNLALMGTDTFDPPGSGGYGPD